MNKTEYLEIIKYLEMRQQDQLRSAQKAKSQTKEEYYQGRARVFSEVATMITRKWARS